MKRLLIAAAVAATTICAPVLAADVGVSVSIGQPGFYGRIDIGDFPPPVVIYRQPKVIELAPATRPPIYLRVPPGHAKHWSKHCHRYNACGERVFFVRDDWYHREYVPRYRERHGDRRDGDHDRYRGNPRWDNDRDGRGNDHRRHGQGQDR